MDVTFYDISTGNPVLHLDTLKMSNLENTADEVSARGGKSNPELLVWDFNREATMQLEDALMSPKSFALLSGNPVVQHTAGDKATIYMRQNTIWEEVSGEMVNKGEFYPLKVVAGLDITLAFTPKEGASTIRVYAVDDDGGTKKTVTSVTDKVVKLTAGQAEVGDEVIVYYTYDVEDAQTYRITSDAFPGTYKIVGDTVIRNAKTGKDEPFQVIVEKAKILSGFSMSFQADGDPSTFTMDIKVLREDDNPGMVRMVKY